MRPSGIHPSAFIAATAVVMGDVTLGEDVSIWYGAVLRGDMAPIVIGEAMRAGKHPKDAGMAALQRIRANTIEKRLQKPNGDPNFNILFYIVNARGEHAGVAMYPEDEGERGWAGQTNTQFVKYSVCDASGPRMLNTEALLPGTAQK